MGLEVMITLGLLIGILGIVFGIGLAVASRFFSVYMDPRIETVAGMLPGANCGGCGKAGCANFAEALVHGSAEVGGCSACGAETSKKIASFLGLKAPDAERRAAVLKCNGRSVKNRFEYHGVSDCVAASLVMGGPKACRYGCLGLGTCVRACPFGALEIRDRMPFVNEYRCVACGSCVSACPKRLYDIVPVSKTVHVRCRNLDRGKMVKEACEVGCIACKKCEKACPHDAIHVIDNVARIDYEKCTSCEKCVEGCPSKSISNDGIKVTVRQAREAAGVP